MCVWLLAWTDLLHVAVKNRCLLFSATKNGWWGVVVFLRRGIAITWQWRYTKEACWAEGKGNNCIKWNKDSLAWLEVASGICFVALALCVGKANPLDTEPLPRLCGMECRNCCCRAVLKGGRKAYNLPPTVTKWMCVWLLMAWTGLLHVAVTNRCLPLPCNQKGWWGICWIRRAGS